MILLLFASCFLIACESDEGPFVFHVTWILTASKRNNSELGYSFLDAGAAALGACSLRNLETTYSRSVYSSNTYIVGCFIRIDNAAVVSSTVMLNVKVGRGFKATGTLTIPTGATVAIAPH